jgi:CRISPR/Cas system-associated exonuclease Cas4 (RecB family)
LTYTKRRNAGGWQKLVDTDDPPETTIIPVPPRSEIDRIATVEIVEPPLVEGQHDSTAAVTSVALFDLCPRKYFLSRYVGVESGQPGAGAMSLGSEVHKVLAGGTSNSLEAQELAGRFPMPDHPTRIEHEFDFLFALEGADVVLRGQIDLWYEQDGELVLVDYKTDRDETPENYSLQLRLYALALERYLGRFPDRAVLFYLRSATAVEISLTSNDLEHTRQAVKNLLSAQNSMEFPLQEGDHCRRCAFYQGLCPAGKDSTG